MIFNYISIVLYTIFIKKNKILSINFIEKITQPTRDDPYTMPEQKKVRPFDVHPVETYNWLKSAFSCRLTIGNETFGPTLCLVDEGPHQQW
jgi:hypothetical protein